MLCQPLDWDLTAADVLRLVRDDPHPVALLGAWADGSDIIAADPVRVSHQPDLSDPSELAELAELAGRPSAEAAFGGGWIGYLGFGAAAGLLPVPPPPGEPRRLPDCWLGYYDHVLRRDRATGRWTFEALVTPERERELGHRLAELCRRAEHPPPGPRDYDCGEFRLTPSPEEHQEAVRQTVRSIRRGDLFQANICLRLEADFDGDPLDAFCRAATRLDPPYAAFLGLSDGAIASLSPELFLRRTGTEILSQPIKGTAPRAADLAEAKRQREALEQSAKDQAENVMIVDLMRNDLSRVCLPGSVTVPRLLHAQAHPGLWHLVSDVRGTLRPGTSDGDLIRATFPPGSVTGAPKVRALELIHELEATPREAYTGAIGYRSPVAGLELSVAIRTFEFHRGRVWVGSGGGITAASDPAAEYQECLVKAAPLVRALGATLSESTIPAPQRPRPALGVFTSLRVTRGATHDLDAHLARLEASTRELFGKPLPAGLFSQLAACLADRPSGRLRITARPCGGPLHVAVEVVPAGATPAGVTLRPFVVPGGLGAHKWRDRRLLSITGLGSAEQLLITAENGDVLETDRGSVFAVVGGELWTPPADGRLLPGITRAVVLGLARQDGLRVRETRLQLSDLGQASEAFITNAVHGLMPVTRLRNAADSPDAARHPDVTWPAGPVAARLRTALDHRPATGPAGAPTRTPGPAPAPADSPGRTRRSAPLTHGDRPLLILIDNYDSFTYNLAHQLLTRDCQVEVVRNDEITAGELAACAPDGLVISPGPGTPADAGISVAAVQACGPSTPVLGICLGHQAIAVAYGAAITTAPPVHGRASPITHDGRGLLAGLPQPFPAARYHSLIVQADSLPPDLIVTARGPGGIPMGLRHVRHPVEGLQFHPESILTAHGDTIIGRFIQVVRAARRSSPCRRTAPPA